MARFPLDPAPVPDVPAELHRNTVAVAFGCGFLLGAAASFAVAVLVVVVVGWGVH